MTAVGIMATTIILFGVFSVFIGLLYLVQRRIVVPELQTLHQRRRQSLRNYVKKQRLQPRNRAVRTSIPAVPVPTYQPHERDIIKHRPVDDKQERVIRRMLNDGYSANDVFTLMRGDRTARLGEIREIKNQLESERLAALIASHDPTPIPPMEPVQ